MTKAEIDSIGKKITNIMNAEFENAKTDQPKARDWLSSQGTGPGGKDEKHGGAHGNFEENRQERDQPS